MMSKPLTLRAAAAFGLAQWVLLVVAQAENIGLSQLALLPLMQAQNAIAAVPITLAGWVAGRATWSRWIFVAAYAVLTALVVVSPGYFQMFGDHPRLSLGEGGMTILPSQLLSSVGAAAAAAWGKLTLNAALAVGAFSWLWRKVLAAEEVAGLWGDGKVFAAVPAVAVALSFAPIPAPVRNAANHPLYPLIQEAFLPRVTVSLSAKAGDDAPVDARDSSAPELAEAAAQIRAASPKPNVVLIVLESVGSPHVLGNLANTPNIAALAGRSIAFENVYAVYPSTARNHLAINTGGYHLTGDGFVEAVQREFTGPLMARGFAAAGYGTALFSSERLDVDGMDVLEQRAGWGTLYDFGRDVTNHRAANILNSWCAREEFTLAQIEPWLDAHRTAPFLLTYMNGATHHPYTVPHGFPEPNGRADDTARFRNSLNYTDAVIGQLIAKLKARGLFENTIIAITGDHGEAFGEHPGNFVHKNAIYDENVRTFLLLSHPALSAPLHSDRIGSSGDLYATLAALAGIPVRAPGRDLTARDFPGRAVFFSKGAVPEQWGLRDGKWKFIQAIRDRQPELYDLSSDPAERTNLAATHPDLVSKFSRQCEQWFLRTQAECLAQFAPAPAQAAAK